MIPQRRKEDFLAEHAPFLDLRPFSAEQIDALGYVVRAALYRLWRDSHPFGDDLSAVASTNS